MAIAKFTLAVPRIGKEGADFPRVIVFGKQAENCEKFLAKGSLVMIQGRIQTGSYEKGGQKVYTTDVIANNVEFIEWVKKEDKPEDPADEFEQLDIELPF